jgi:hypothetical protein
LPLAVPVAVAPGPLVAAPVTKPTKKADPLLFEHGLNGRPDVRPQAILDWIIPACVGSGGKDELSVFCFMA